MINISLDATMLASLMSCPRKFNWRFNDNWVKRTGKGNSLECGSIAHAILEFYNKALIAGKDKSNALTEGFAAGKEYIVPFSSENKYITDESHEGVVNTPAENTKDGKTEILGYNYVFQTMVEYFEYYKNDSHTVIAAEETRKKLIYESDEMRIMWGAKFDEIDDTQLGIISTDHKTMKQRRDTLSLNVQFKGQCVVLGSRNVRVNKIGFQKTLPPREKFERAILSYSNDALTEFTQEIVPHYAMKLYEYTELGYWPPNYDSCEGKYGWCDYKEVEEHDRNMRDEVLKLNFIKGKKWVI